MQHIWLRCTSEASIFALLGGSTAPPLAAKQRGSVPMFSSLINNVRDRVEKRKRYNRLTAEILGMSDRDLADIRGNRTEMLRHVYRDVYGS
jgi:hypothetical protein